MTLPAKRKEKLYCYVDESGQDARSHSFVVVAIVSNDDQSDLREALTEVEREARTDGFKWHKTQSKRRLHYLKRTVERRLAHGEVFFGTYRKPLPFFFPMLEVLESAIKMKATSPYTARIFVDGIDHQKAIELTNALRIRGVSLELVRSRRDESEPLIRLADMWAGCIRLAGLRSEEAAEVLDQAIKNGYIRRIKENTPNE